MEYVLGNKYFHTSNSHIMLQKTAMEKKSQPYERMGFCVQRKEKYLIYSRCQNIV